MFIVSVRLLGCQDNSYLVHSNYAEDFFDQSLLFCYMSEMKSKRSRKTNLTPIASILRDSQKKTQAVFTLSALRKKWPEIVGDMLSKQTKPKKIERNMLWISVENAALNYELSMMKVDILSKIFEHTQSNYKDIKFFHEPFKKQEASETESKQKFVRAELKENESLQEILDRVRSMSKNLQNND